MQLDFEVFPNGETRVKGEQLQKYMAGVNIVQLKYENDSDLIKLMFVKSYLDEYNVRSSLTITYLPYSRMDRVEGDSVFTLKYVANFINNLNFGTVTIIEPHSDVSSALINKCRTFFPTFKLLDKVVAEIGFNKEKDYLFYPDSTAMRRYGKVQGYKQLYANKKRDFKTGRITDLQLSEDVDLLGAKIIMQDDLCSYGGTFLLSAEKLKERGASEIYLIVGHCEESIFKGKIPESNLMERVYTTNSIISESKHEKVKIYSITGDEI
jgi:ribose-phosphate pyrophosphokinase